MLKKPTKKSVKDTAPQVVAIVGGAMAGQGIESLVPASNPNHKKLAVLGVGLVLALAYNGPKKDVAKNVGIGMVASKTMDFIQETARKNITPNAAPNPIEKAGYSALGLMCACDDQYDLGMGNPGRTSIAEVVYTDVYTQDNTQDVGHKELLGV